MFSSARTTDARGQFIIRRMGAPCRDWYLPQWLAATGKRQADLVRDLDLNKALVSLLCSGKQQYTRDRVNEIAGYLNIQPYELLMHPSEAADMKQMRKTALAIARRNSQDQDPPPIPLSAGDVRKVKILGR